MILLSEKKIYNYLQNINCKLFKDIILHIFPTIDSTNQFLKDHVSSNDQATLHVCCAETQTAGRGRFGRTWISPISENIYFSAKLTLSIKKQDLSGLSLVVGLAVRALLDEYNLAEEIFIKWPNDLLWGQKKICGILIESTNTQQIGNTTLIIGIGLNINSNTKQEKYIGSLAEIYGQEFDRNLLVAKLIIHLSNKITQLINNGFISFQDEWVKADYLYNKQISIIQPKQQLSGVAKGIDHLGQLILEDDQGIKHYLLSGETSIVK